jgi:hypothetical protein
MSSRPRCAQAAGFLPYFTQVARLYGGLLSRGVPHHGVLRHGQQRHGAGSHRQEDILLTG